MVVPLTLLAAPMTLLKAWPRVFWASSSQKAQAGALNGRKWKCFDYLISFSFSHKEWGNVWSSPLWLNILVFLSANMPLTVSFATVFNTKVHPTQFAIRLELAGRARSKGVKCRGPFCLEGGWVLLPLHVHSSHSKCLLSFGVNGGTRLAPELPPPPPSPGDLG